MKRGNPSSEKRKVTTYKARMPATPVASLICGDDEASLKRHYKMMSSEMKKVTPNKQVIQKLMMKTFVPRRKEILEGMGTIQDILTAYPALKYPDEVRLVVKMYDCVLDTFIDYS